MVEIWLWTQKQDIGPPQRAYSGMTYDPENHKTLMFGGYDGSTFLDDTWDWDGSAWTQVADIGPSQRALMAMAFDSENNKTVLFGGINSNYGVLNDTWEWNGNGWTQ